VPGESPCRFHSELFSKIAELFETGTEPDRHKPPEGKSPAYDRVQHLVVLTRNGIINLWFQPLETTEPLVTLDSSEVKGMEDVHQNSESQFLRFLD
jgi:hypothetical protein